MPPPDLPPAEDVITVIRAPKQLLDPNFQRHLQPCHLGFVDKDFFCVGMPLDFCVEIVD